MVRAAVATRPREDMKPKEQPIEPVHASAPVGVFVRRISVDDGAAKHSKCGEGPSRFSD